MNNVTSTLWSTVKILKEKQQNSSCICAAVRGEKSKVQSSSPPFPTYPLSGLFLYLNLDSISPMSLILCTPSPLHHLPADPYNSFPASRMHPHM